MRIYELVKGSCFKLLRLWELVTQQENTNGPLTKILSHRVKNRFMQK